MGIVSGTVAVASAGKSLWDTFDLGGGNDDPALPDPLPLTAGELDAAFQANPRAAEQIRSYIQSIGFAGSPPNRATMDEIQRSTRKLAEQAIYLANGAPAHSRQGIGEGFGPEEQKVRGMVVSLMEGHRSGASAAFDAAQVAGDDGPGFTEELSGLLDRIARTDELQERAEAAVSGAGAGASAGVESARVRQSTPQFLQGNAWPIALAVGGIAVAALFRN